MFWNRITGPSNAGCASQHFRSFWGAWHTIAGYEAIHMIRKGQACWSAAGCEGRSTAPLHSRSVRCDELSFRSSTQTFSSTTKLQHIQLWPATPGPVRYKRFNNLKAQITQLPASAVQVATSPTPVPTSPSPSQVSTSSTLNHEQRNQQQ